MKRFFTCLMVSIVVSMVLSACSDRQLNSDPSMSSAFAGSESEAPYSSANNNSSDNGISGNSVINCTLDSGVVVDATVQLSPTVDFSHLSVYDGELQRLSIDPVIDELVGEEYSEMRQETKESAFSDAEYIQLEKPDGTILSCSESALSFTSPQLGDIESYLWLERGASNYNGAAFLTGKEFAFGTQQECFKEIRETLNSLGVSVCDDYICYSVDNNVLTEEAERYKENLLSRAREIGLLAEDGSPISEEELYQDLPDPSYTVDDDCYYYVLFPSVNGVPITREDTGIFENGGLISGSIIEVIYSKEGIVHLYLNSIYQVNEKIQAEKGMDTEEALAWLDEKYNNIILDGDYEVQEISFEYVPISKGDRIHVELVPAWRFGVLHTMSLLGKTSAEDAAEVQVYEQIMVNAVTGKEIVKEVGNA